FFLSRGLESKGGGVAGGNLVGDLKLQSDQVDAPSAEVECVQSIGLAQMRVGVASLGYQSDGVLGVGTQLDEEGAKLGGLTLAVGGPGVDPESEVSSVALED